MRAHISGSPKQKGDGIRVLRVEKEVLFQLSKYLMSQYTGDLSGLLTLTRVQMPADLRSAKVYFSLMQASPAEEEQALEWLKDRAVDMQSHLGRNLQMRYTPRLSFFVDRSLERALRIDSLLHEISSGKSED